MDGVCPKWMVLCISSYDNMHYNITILQYICSFNPAKDTSTHHIHPPYIPNAMTVLTCGHSDMVGTFRSCCHVAMLC